MGGRELSYLHLGLLHDGRKMSGEGFYGVR